MLVSTFPRPDMTGNRAIASHIVIAAGIFVVLLVLAIVSLGVGRVYIAPERVLAILLSKYVAVTPVWTPAEALIVMNVRLPRICAALMVGAALAGAGSAYQNLFRNPIVSPDILGVSAGAGFGASIGVMFNLGAPGIQVAAFAMGLVAVILCFFISQMINRHSPIVLVLIGVVIAAFFQAMISIIKIVADPINVLPVITFWLLGGLNKITAAALPSAAVVIAASLTTLFVLRWQANVMGVGEEEARSLGVNVSLIRILLVLSATLMTAAAVSISGIVGWVGLVVPHMARLLVGSSFDRALPVAMLTGALFVLLVDNLARAASSMELPLGIVTSVIGAPLFIILLIRSRAAWA